MIPLSLRYWGYFLPGILSFQWPYFIQVSHTCTWLLGTEGPGEALREKIRRGSKGDSEGRRNFGFRVNTLSPLKIQFLLLFLFFFLCQNVHIPIIDFLLEVRTYYQYRLLSSTWARDWVKCIQPIFERMFRLREKSGATTMYKPTRSTILMAGQGSATPDYLHRGC